MPLIVKNTMKFFVYFSIIWIVFSGCQRKMTAKVSAVATNNIPSCIQQKIDSIKQQPVWNPPAEINEYNYSGSKVFLISANCCDFYSVVFDTNCNYVCAPSGGFTGKGDRKCTDFFKQAKFVRIVWKDERSRESKNRIK